MQPRVGSILWWIEEEVFVVVTSIVDECGSRNEAIYGTYHGIRGSRWNIKVPFTTVRDWAEHSIMIAH